MKNICIKKSVMKRFCLLFFSVCLLAGAVAVLNPSAAINAQAAAKSTKLEKTVTTIVGKQTKKKDNKKQKLKKLFNYTEKTYGYARLIKNGKPYVFKQTKGWEKTYAVEMYSKKKGSCYHYASAYAFLAKKATGYPVRIGIGKTNGFNKNTIQPHAWAEIKIGSTWYICDPNMDKFAAKSSGKYYLKKRSSLKKTYNKFKDVKYTTVKF